MLVIEFAISLHAMCDLLMIFEAVQVWDPKMRGIKHLSKEIHENLANIYEKELYVLETANKKRYKRHREANIYLERLQKNRFPGCEDWNVEDEVNKFLEELDRHIEWYRSGKLKKSLGWKAIGQHCIGLGYAA